ncbi:MAG: hypothetical protein U0401_20225 [Anaerolineae bacterium]
MNTSTLTQWGAYLRRKADEQLLTGLRWLARRQMVVRRSGSTPSAPTGSILGQPDRVAILLAGCGGTGSYCAHILAQLAALALTSGLDLRLYYIDPDLVEEKIRYARTSARPSWGRPKP